MDEKDRDDMMDRLLELGRDKKNFLTFDDLNRELPEGMVAPEDLEDVLQKLKAAELLLVIPIHFFSKKQRLSPLMMRI
jgi:hypothetical protein